MKNNIVNQNSCREFIDYTSDYLFNKDVKNWKAFENQLGE